jgi:hypothetical protein
MSSNKSTKVKGNENKGSSNPLQNDRTYISGGFQTSASHQFHRDTAGNHSSKNKNE